jgi:hypothetical protein
MGIPFWLTVTYGLSRLLHWILSDKYPGNKRNVVANIGSILIISLCFVPLLFNHSARLDVVAISTAFVVACQTFWYWRDNSTLPFSPESNTKRLRDAKWQVAVEYYPDLASIDSQLRGISEGLADQFRAFLDEKKSFADRHKIAAQLEADFWTTSFGRNPKIVSFAKQLIQSGNKQAAKELEIAVAVLGDTADVALVIERIQKKFPNVRAKPTPQEPVAEIAKRLLRTQDTADAKLLLHALGGEVQVTREPMSPKKVLTLRFRDQTQRFYSEHEMTRWVTIELAKAVQPSKS